MPPSAANGVKASGSVQNVAETTITSHDDLWLPKPSSKAIIWAQFMIIYRMHVWTKFEQPLPFILSLSGALIYSLFVAFLYFQLPYAPESATSLRWVTVLNTVYFTATSNVGGFTLFKTDRLEHLPCATNSNTKIHFSPVAIWFGRYLAEMPFRIVLSLISSIIIYPIVGLRPGFGFYLLYLHGLVLQAFANGALGLVVATIARDAYFGALLSVAVFSVNFLFCGIFYTSGQVTWILLWLRYLSVAFYVGQILIYDQFKDATYPDTSINGNDVLQRTGWLVQPLVISIIGVIVLSIIFNMIGILFLWLTSRPAKGDRHEN